MNKFTLSISSLFNKSSRLPILDYNGIAKAGQFENGPLDCQRIDICMEGHLSTDDLTNTKTFGSLFQTNQISWLDINALSVKVASQYSRPSDPLLAQSVSFSFDAEGNRKETKRTLSEDTVFSLVAPDKPIRHAQAKSDARDISFISLRVGSVREKPSLVFD